MIESPYKISTDDKTKSRSARAAVDQDSKTAARTNLDTIGPTGVPDNKVRETQEVDTKVMASTNSDANGNSMTAVTPRPDPEVGENKPLKSNSNKANLDVSDISSNSELDNSTQKDIHAKQSKGQTMKNVKSNVDSDNLVSSTSTNNADKAGGLHTNIPAKQQGEKKPAAQPHASRSVLEDNIVLGVALDGSKRTLPIDEGSDTDTVTAQEAKEMAAFQGGNGSPKAADGNGK